MEERHGTRCKRASKDVKAVPDESASAKAASATAVGEIAQWVVFSLDAGRYALPLIAVDRIVRAAYITSLPLAPDIVLGAIDIAGRVLPVFNTRRRFRLPERTIDPADHLLIARTAQRTVVLVIDAAQGVFERPTTAMIDAASIAPDLEHIHGVIQLEDGLVLIHDLEHFLSPDEARTLDEAMNQQVSHAG
jgi:purine-binding chemotaxis protein CheW